MERLPSVQRLGAPLQGALRAQAVVASPQEAVAELVANSLDAGAREVHVELDLQPASLGFTVRDDGGGVRSVDLPLLGQRYATSKHPSAAAATVGAAAAGSTQPPLLLGYRGEALAAICEAAAAVEVTSRAGGCFETHTCILRSGQAARLGLAPEQRKRQGTVVAVRGLFASQPVRRKALQTAGLQREADRCREVVLRLALLRPEVTFTLFDRGRRAFVLRLLRGRAEVESVAEFLGQPAAQLAVVASVPDAAHAVTGYAVLPPHGYPSTGRQCVYLNGRWVKASPISKLAEALFQPLYKANIKLAQAQGDDLRQVHKASNRHPAYVLHLSCPSSEYELSHEADGTLVQFRSWEPLLATVRHALLAAWRLALNNSLLKELEQLEGGGSDVAPDCGAAAVRGRQQQEEQQQQPLTGDLFQQWLSDQQAEAALVLPASSGARGSRQQVLTEIELAEAAELPAGSSGSRRRGSGRGRHLTGAKHTLASRLVRYNAATACAAPDCTGARHSAPGAAATVPGGSLAGRDEPRGRTGAPWASAQLDVQPQPAQEQQPPNSGSRVWQQNTEVLPTSMQQVLTAGRSVVLASLLAPEVEEEEEGQQPARQRQRRHQQQQKQQQGCLPWDPDGHQEVWAAGNQEQHLQQRARQKQLQGHLPWESDGRQEVWETGSQQQQQQQQQDCLPWQLHRQEQDWQSGGEQQRAGRQGQQQLRDWLLWEADGQQEGWAAGVTREQPLPTSPPKYQAVGRRQAGASSQQQQQQQQRLGLMSSEDDEVQRLFDSWAPAARRTQQQQQQQQHQSWQQQPSLHQRGEQQPSQFMIDSEDGQGTVLPWEGEEPEHSPAWLGCEQDSQGRQQQQPGSQEQRGRGALPWPPRQQATITDEERALLNSMPAAPPRQHGRRGRGALRGQQGGPPGRQAAITAEEQALLRSMPAEPRRRLAERRPQSAPPHPAQVRRAVDAKQRASRGPLAAAMERGAGLAAAAADAQPIAAGGTSRAAQPASADQPVQAEKHWGAEQTAGQMFAPSGDTSALLSSTSHSEHHAAALDAVPETPAGNTQPSSDDAQQQVEDQPAAIVAVAASTHIPAHVAAAPRAAPAAVPAPAPAQAALAEAVPSFLQHHAGLEALLPSWRQPPRRLALQPSAGPGGSIGGGGSILTLEAVAAGAFAQLAPSALNREQLRGRALPQLDRKFVPLMSGSLLSLVDQHAADERVQLERLRDQLLGPSGQLRPGASGSQGLRAPLPLGLTEAEQQLLEVYRHKVEVWGWRWQPGRGAAGPLLTHSPVLWGTALTPADLKLYLHHLQDTCGAGGLPAGVVRVLNSKACRGAIMFGDMLEQGQCQVLLERLRATQLCFSCAHGRPTTAPLVDLLLLRRALQLRGAAQLSLGGIGDMGGHGVDAQGTSGGGSAQGGLAGLKRKLERLVR